jgi:hypothetical protein
MSNEKISRNKIDSIYTKNLNKTNGQTRCLKVKNVTYFGMARVHIALCMTSQHRNNQLH